MPDDFSGFDLGKIQSRLDYRLSSQPVISRLIESSSIDCSHQPLGYWRKLLCAVSGLGTSW